MQEMRIGAKKAEAAKKGDLVYWEAVKTLPVGSKLYLTAKQSLLAKAPRRAIKMRAKIRLRN